MSCVKVPFRKCANAFCLWDVRSKNQVTHVDLLSSAYSPPAFDARRSASLPKPCSRISTSTGTCSQEAGLEGMGERSDFPGRARHRLRDVAAAWDLSRQKKE
jgi:hypothetical protein